MSTPKSNKRTAFNCDTSTDPSPTSAATTLDTTATSKRLKTQDMSSTPKVLTYEVVGSGVSVQVRSDQTIHDLVAIVCDETCVGMNEDVWAHMWYVTDTNTGNEYESGDIECTSDLRANTTKIGSIVGGKNVGSELILTYDYGTTSVVILRLESIEDMPSDIDNTSFPRRAPLPGQASFVPYNPDNDDAPNMDELYPDLSKFLFTNDDYKNAEIYLFQPGKKKVHGYIEKGYDALSHAIHVPDKFSSVEELLYALNESCKYDKPPYMNGHPESNWFGVNIFPLTPSARFNKYKSAGCPGLDTTVARGYDDTVDKTAFSNKFLKTFPKCAAAAGFNQKGKASKSTERGWIIYRNGTLTACRGDSKVIKSRAPSPGVFDGQNKHEPQSDANIVGKVNVRVKSLQELFCAAEALW